MGDSNDRETGRRFAGHGGLRIGHTPLMPLTPLTPLTILSWVLLATSASSLDFADLELVYREDYEAELAYPTTPELDEIGAGGLVADSLVAGAGPVLTGSAAHATVSILPGIGFDYQLNRFLENSVGGDSIGFRMDLEVTNLTPDTDYVFTGIAAGFDGLPVNPTLRFVIGLERNLAGVTSARFELVVLDRFNVVTDSVEIPLSAAETAALTSGAPARIDGFVDRDLGTAIGSLEITGFAPHVAGPLPLADVPGPSTRFAGASQQLAAFSPGGTSPTGVTEVDFESFEVYRPRGVSFSVDTHVDDVDASPGDGLCETLAGDCSLRAAIQEANASSAGDEIVVPAGTYLLTRAGAGEDLAESGDLDILNGLVIRGAGRDATIVDAGGLDRVFDLPASAQGVAVHLRDLTIRNGVAAVAGGDAGGGVRSWGELTLERCIVSNNQASRGGGLMNFDALVVEDCVVSDNAAIVVESINPHAGGIASVRAPGFDPARSVTIRRSAVVNNTAFATGGVEIENTALVTIENSTISGNADTQLGLVNADLVLQHATIVGGAGPGLRSDLVSISTQSLEYANSAIEGTPACDIGVFPPIDVLYLGANASNDLSCAFGSAEGSSEGVPLGLAPLDLTSASPFHSPMSGSPLIDSAEAAYCLIEDQLGSVRPLDGDASGSAECDLGAIEVPEPGFAIALLVSVGALARARRIRASLLPNGKVERKRDSRIARADRA